MNELSPCLQGPHGPGGGSYPGPGRAAYVAREASVLCSRLPGLPSASITIYLYHPSQLETSLCLSFLSTKMGDNKSSSLRS